MITAVFSSAGISRLVQLAFISSVSFSSSGGPPSLKTSEGVLSIPTALFVFSLSIASRISCMESGAVSTLEKVLVVLNVSFRWFGSVEQLFEVRCPGFYPLVSVRHELPL